MKFHNQPVHSSFRSFAALTAKRYARHTAIFTLCALSASVVSAETVQLPPLQPAVAENGNKPWSVPVPSRGQSKTQVESTYGSPQSKEGPSGTPPIYYWEYAEFTVYFESDYVIHAVRKYKPK
ncbi:hypothetical protein [Teredinibacter franksiae]|jgi:hypothetical protein|uniref:hypothetical protein n=1 Tax=Teredinibacter franksiae TaxID=2761453 RepID=UPI001FE35C39|nr:hypothetical protein [Teredinibacter franksiae]